MHSSQRYGGDGGPPAGPVAPDPRLPLRLARACLRVIVLGDAVLDGWFTGRTDRLCREGPVAVVDVERRRFTPGAAGNLAVNLASLGARTTLLARVGDDADGRLLLRDLDRVGVDGSGTVTEPGHATTTKVRVAASDQLLVRFDEHRPRPAPAATVSALLARLDAELGTADAVVVADYGLGLLGAPVRDHLARIRDRIPLLVVDAHDCRRWARTRPDLVTPSAQEAARLVPGALSARARTAADSHASGAGDAFTAATTLAAAGGVPWPQAVALGQAAADVVVAEPGPTTCDTAALTAHLGGRPGEVIGLPELEAAVAAHRAAGRRIVFSNGCFDVLHRAHVACLEEARRLGDVLVVAVNSDAGVRRLKGPGRPVNPAEDRAAVLAALACVDHTTVFDEDTPAELLRRLRPDVYVKGGDYTPQMLAETSVVEAYGGQVRIVRYVPGHSTTAVIERILAHTSAVPSGSGPSAVPSGSGPSAVPAGPQPSGAGP